MYRLRSWAICRLQRTGKASYPACLQHRANISRLDGLNKDMRDWDVAHYGRIFNAACKNAEMPIIQYPEGQQILCLVARDI